MGLVWSVQARSGEWCGPSPGEKPRCYALWSTAKVELADPRHAKGIRPVQLSSLTIMVMAMLCGRTSLKGIARFARTHVQALAEVIPLPRDKAPSYSTLQRLSQQLSIEGLCRQFNRWMPQYAQAETIAIDGKRITRTFPPKEGEKQRVTSLVSFFSHPRQLICGVGKLDLTVRSN